MGKHLKKLAQVLLAACLCIGMMPLGAMATGNRQDGMYGQGNINDMVSSTRADQVENPDGSVSYSSTVNAVAGQLADFRATISIDGRQSGSLAEVLASVLKVQLTAGTQPYKWEWSLTEWPTADPASAVRVPNDNAPWRIGAQAQASVPDYALSQDSALLKDEHSYRYQITVTDSTGLKCLSEGFTVVVSQRYQSTSLYYDKDDPTDFKVRVDASVAAGAVLSAPPLQEGSAAYEDIRTQLADGRMIADTWDMSITHESADPIDSVHSVYVEVSRDLYNKVIANSTAVKPAAYIVGYENGTPVRVGALPITAADVAFYPESATSADAAERIYVKFRPVNEKTVGTYALVYDDPEVPQAVVHANIGGQMGQILPVGTVRYPVVGASERVRYTLLPAQGYCLESYAVTEDASESTVASGTGESLPDGQNYIEFAVEGGKEYTVSATFAKVEVDASRQVDLYAVAQAEEGAQGKEASVTIVGADPADANPATFDWGSPTGVVFAGTGVELKRVQVAVVEGRIPAANAESIAAGIADADWHDAVPVGSSFSIGALTENTVVRMVYGDKKNDGQPKVAVTGSARMQGGSTVQLVEGKNDLDYANITLDNAAPEMGQTAGFTVQVKPGWRLSGATLTMRDPKAAPGADPLDVRDVLDDMVGGTLAIWPAVCNYDVAFEFSRVRVQLQLGSTANGSISAVYADGAALDPNDVEYGRNVRLSFTPDVRFEVDEIDLGGAVEVSRTQLPDGTLQVVVQLTGTTAVAATFKPKDMTDLCEVEVRHAQGGSVLQDGAVCGNVVYVHRDKPTELTLRADYGYKVDVGRLTLDGTQISFAAQSGNTLNEAGTVATVRIAWAANARVLQAAFVKADGGSDEIAYTKVDVQVSGGGTVTPGGMFTAVVGSTQQFSFLPDEGRKLASVTVVDGNGNPVYADGTQADFAAAIRANGYKYPFQIVDGMTMVVRFAALDAGEQPPQVKSHVVKVKREGRGYTSPSGTVRVAEGADLTVTMAPHAGWRIAGLRVGSGFNSDKTADIAADGTYTLVNVRADTDVLATFAQATPVTVTIPVSTTPGGSVTCGTDGLVGIVGSALPVSIVPDDGYKVGQLVIVRTDAETGEEVREVVDDPGTSYVISPVTEDIVRLEVSFQQVTDNPPTYQSGRLSISKIGRGTVFPPAGSQKMLVGNTLQLVFVPDAGFQVQDVTVDGAVVATGVSSYDFTMPDTGDHAIAVTFKECAAGDLLDVSVEVKAQISVNGAATLGAGGVVSPTSATVKRGGSQRFYVFPHDGYDVKEISYTTADGTKTQVTRLSLVQKVQVSRAAAEDGLQVLSGVYALRSFSLSGMAARNGDTAGYSFQIEDIQSDLSIDVTFESSPGTTWADRESVSITHSGAGMVSPSGQFMLAAGTTVQTDLYVAAFSGHHLAHLWYTDAKGSTTDMKDRVEGGFLHDIALQAGCSVHAEFQPDTATVGITVDRQVMVDGKPVATISPAGQLTVEKGGFQTFYFKAVEGSGKRVAQVVVDYADGRRVVYAVPEGAAEYTLYGLEEGMRVSFVAEDGSMEEKTFFTVEPVVQVGSDGQIHGAISPAEAFEYPEGASQKFIFLPDDDAVIKSVRITPSDTDNGVAHELSADEWASGSYTLRGISQDMTIAVCYEKVITHTITIGCSEGGTITGEGIIEGRLQVLDGQQVRLQVTPDEANGYEIAEVSYVPAAGVARASSQKRLLEVKDGHVSFTAAEDAAVYATFTKSTAPPVVDDPEGWDFYIEATAGDHGSIKPAGRIGVASGADKVFSLVPDTGYQVKQVVVDGKAHRGDYREWRFAAVSANHTIIVEFEPKVLPGANDPISRAIRKLQSLAATGDANVPLALALVSVACVALAFVSFSSGRRKAEGRHVE